MSEPAVDRSESGSRTECRDYSVKRSLGVKGSQEFFPAFLQFDMCPAWLAFPKLNAGIAIPTANVNKRAGIIKDRDNLVFPTFTRPLFLHPSLNFFLCFSPSALFSVHSLLSFVLY